MHLPAETFVVWAILVALAGAVLCALTAKFRQLSNILALASVAFAALFVLLASGMVFVSGPAVAPHTVFSPGGDWPDLRFHIDGLAALFLGLVVFITLAASVFSCGYMAQPSEYGLLRYTPNLLLFFAGMLGLLATTDLFFYFFFFWQLMTLPSYQLIRYEHRIAAYRHAANKYLLMMQLAVVAIMLGSALLAAPHPSLAYDLDAMTYSLPELLVSAPARATLAFSLVLLGFGIKMGLWPFGQIWLPDAHPAAPSPISALLSGVMLKTGVYGVLRLFLCFAPPGIGFPVAAWGACIMVCGLLTLTTGTLQALQQDQSKRLLAFSSIGQIGYIALGLGAAMVLSDVAPALALCALLGALLHVIHHALFKSLLFLNAGSILTATGSQDMNKLGGLFALMPITGICALIASLAIAGVPLFNGFTSKWLLYTATLLAGRAAWFLPLCGAIALMVSVFTLALFIKYFGTLYLSRRSAWVDACAQNGKRMEGNYWLLTPQIALAALCVFLGLFPWVGITLLARALATSPNGIVGALGQMLTYHPEFLPLQGWGMGLNNGTAHWLPILLGVILAALFFLGLLLSRLGGASARTDAPWLCGYAQETEQNRYNARQFYSDIKRALAWLGGAPAATAAAASDRHPLHHHNRQENLRTRKEALYAMTAAHDAAPETVQTARNPTRATP